MADLPGMNLLAVALQAPADLLNLATRQVNETLAVMNNGVQRMAMELSVPPALPQGLPALPQGLPSLPGLGGFSAPPASGAAAQAAFGEAAPQYKKIARVII